MKVLILGMDGYIGWALGNYLLEKGHEVRGIDNFFRRGVAVSANPISDSYNRIDQMPYFRAIDLDDVEMEELLEWEPDAIYHLAEQPSAPWSMMWYSESINTQSNNVLGTLRLLWMIKELCPSTHLIKIGTMGEYGTPNCVIPEGMIEPYCQRYPDLLCPMEGLMFPRSPGSFYHLSKVFDSYNIKFACDIWRLRSTDIMQGIVFGLEYNTRFDYDQYFGTVINRFCVQALAGIPLTIYGAGTQIRSFLPLSDSLKCLELALLNPPRPGEYRTFNQFATVLNLNDCADLVVQAASELGIIATKQHLPNPRVESEKHCYYVRRDNLSYLGYEPNYDFLDVIKVTLQKLLPHAKQIRRDVIFPTTTWR